MPSWSDFNHFTRVTSINFTDGTKYEDISKVRPIYLILGNPLSLNCVQILVPTAYNAFAPSQKRWMALLKAIRHYNILDVYSGLIVQTEHTLKAYVKALIKFSDAIQVCK